MDVKQIPLDPQKGVIKTESDLVSGQIEENISISSKQQTCENYHNVLTDNVDVFESRTAEQMGNVCEIKQEIIECEVPKIGPSLFSDLLTKIDHNFLCENFIKNVPVNIKEEIFNVRKVKASDMFVDIAVIKQEFSNVQQKMESELLTADCDLTTLNSEQLVYTDYAQPCSSKQPERLQKTGKYVCKRKRRLYECLVCQKNFPTSKSRSIHIDGHFRKRFAVCQFCGKLLMTNTDFVRHCFIHLVKNRTGNSSQKINEVSWLHKHVVINSIKKPFKCDICSKKFKQQSSLQRHLLIHSTKKSFSRDICSKEFNKETDLQQHLIFHPNENQCDICSKKFKSNSHLKRHLVIHTNEKPFKCNICSKGFNDKSTLQNHLIIHSNEKLFKCHFCYKGFNRKYILQQHLIIHSNKKPFKCDICSKEFNHKSSLKKHIRHHSNEKPLKCDICSKVFNPKFNIAKHIKNHSIKKLFKCDICSKEFKRNRYLKRHLIIHAIEKPFKCDICLKEFNRKTSLKTHLITHKIPVALSGV